jgi:hypothetical protein
MTAKRHRANMQCTELRFAQAAFQAYYYKVLRLTE